MGTVGRRRELEELGVDVRAGRHVAVVGPMGVGKSHLVRAVLRRSGVHALVGTGLRLGQDRDGLALAIALGEPPPADVGAAAAARWCAERLRGRRLVVENLQWVDARSLAVLAHLGVRTPLILTGRDRDGLPLAAARLLVDCRVHELGPLGPAADRVLTRALGALSDEPVLAGRPRQRPGARRRLPVGQVLTEREREVLREVRTGATTEEIARRLGVAPSTAETHIRSAMHKLGARTRCQAALFLDAEVPAHA